MTVLASSMATANPMCFAEDRKGNLFFATGLERAQRWAQGDTATEDVGLTAPTSGIAPSAGGSGSIQGVYKVALRYVDDEGNPSNLSEITTLVATASAYTTISYTSVTVPSEDRVDHKQIWRTTDGQEVTYYLDVDDLANAATSASSHRTDTELRAQVAMRYVTAKGFPNAMRFLPPPTHTGVMVAFKNRMWYAVPSAYAGGSSVTVSGTTAVSGASTKFTSHMVGQQFHSTLGIAEIDSVTNATNLVLVTAISNGTVSTYSILPSSAEYDALYFSEVDEPESVPESNKLFTYADNDRITALMPLYGALYIFKRNHIYRLTTCADPRIDTDIALVAERGCLNQRTWCRAEGMAFIMDRHGVYLFDGKSTQAISGPIQNYWQDGTINLSAHKWFSAVHDRRRESVMFFVAKDSDTRPQHALCFNYRQQQWWEESYGSSVHSAVEGQLDDEPRVLGGVGSTACKFDEGYTDQSSAISFRVKYGQFNTPEVETEQSQGVGLRFTPTGSAQTVGLKYYYDGSATAETAEVDHNNEMGLSVSAGDDEWNYALSRSEGWLRWPLDGGGRERLTPADRTLAIELTGSASQSVVLHEIQIDGVMEGRQ